MIVIYRRAVPEKEYHLVLALGPNNSIKVQGIALEGYEVEEIGSLPPVWIERLNTELRWERDLIVFHCYRYEDVAKIPSAENAEELRPAAPPTQPVYASGPSSYSSPAPERSAPVREPAPATDADMLNGNLRRGHRMKIRFGANTWDAVYWGKDDQGQVIAHQTYERWSLMHLDLNRFRTGLVIEPDVDTRVVREIERSIANS
jgi:hypothetical protein